MLKVVTSLRVWCYIVLSLQHVAALIDGTDVPPVLPVKTNEDFGGEIITTSSELFLLSSLFTMSTSSVEYMRPTILLNQDQKTQSVSSLFTKLNSDFESSSSISAQITQSEIHTQTVGQHQVLFSNQAYIENTHYETMFRYPCSEVVVTNSTRFTEVAYISSVVQRNSRSTILTSYATSVHTSIKDYVVKETEVVLFRPYETLKPASSRIISIKLPAYITETLTGTPETTTMSTTFTNKRTEVRNVTDLVRSVLQTTVLSRPLSTSTVLPTLFYKNDTNCVTLAIYEPCYFVTNTTIDVPVSTQKTDIITETHTGIRTTVKNLLPVTFVKAQDYHTSVIGVGCDSVCIESTKTKVRAITHHQQVRNTVILPVLYTTAVDLGSTTDYVTYTVTKTEVHPAFSTLTSLCTSTNTILAHRTHQYVSTYNEPLQGADKFNSLSLSTSTDSVAFSNKLVQTNSFTSLAYVPSLGGASSYRLRRSPKAQSLRIHTVILPSLVIFLFIIAVV